MTIEQLNPLIDYTFKMLQAGYLKKTAIAHFTNKGLPFDAAENIVELAACRLENFTSYKIK